MKKLITLLLSFLMIQSVANATVKFYDLYMPEPLPENAPDWMKAIAENPSGVNFYEMQEKYQEWAAADVDVRVRIVENKQVVNFYRRWMSAYCGYVTSDGTIKLPTMAEYKAYVDAINSSSKATQSLLKSELEQPIWRNIGPNKTYTNQNGELKQKDSQVCVYRIAVSMTDSATLYC
ncbi:MAG: hypothetical protein IKK64_05585 [Bacteroidales bacterium]|nr:hypothetical protein [Bacteroidales bacterium]